MKQCKERFETNVMLTYTECTAKKKDVYDKETMRQLVLGLCSFNINCFQWSQAKEMLSMLWCISASKHDVYWFDSPESQTAQEITSESCILFEPRRHQSVVNQSATLRQRSAHSNVKSSHKPITHLGWVQA